MPWGLLPVVVPVVPGRDTKKPRAQVGARGSWSGRSEEGRESWCVTCAGSDVSDLAPPGGRVTDGLWLRAQYRARSPDTNPGRPVVSEFTPACPGRPATQRVRLTVCDTGPGFPENILQRAFVPYVTTKPRGTGLGLAVVKKIADEHGARITIGNRVQGGVVLGAQVSLLIPASDQPLPQDRGAEARTMS